MPKKSPKKSVSKKARKPKAAKKEKAKKKSVKKTKAKPARSSAVPKKPAAPKLDKATITALVNQAGEGKLVWLDRAIKKAGYIDPADRPGDELLTQLTFRKQKSLERFFAVSRQTIHRWITNSNPMPVEVDGSYSPARITRWRLMQGAADENIGQKLDNARVKKAEAVAESEQMKVQEMKKDLINKTSVFRKWRQYITMLASQIRSWPPGIISEIPQEHRSSVAKILNEYVNMLLKDLADTTAYEADIDGKKKSEPGDVG